MRLTLCFLLLITFSSIQAQIIDSLPYHQIPDYPEGYTSGNIVSRLIDGLGFRYYWATEGLTEKDLAYRPSEDARNTLETIEHIYSLSRAIVNAPSQRPNVRGEREELTYEELRSKTLRNFEQASKLLLGKTEKDIADFPIIFQRGEEKFEFPFWNLINGQIADAIYHTGQIVTLRRASGNPINPKVNVFMGRTGE